MEERRDPPEEPIAASDSSTKKPEGAAEAGRRFVGELGALDGIDKDVLAVLEANVLGDTATVGSAPATKALEELARKRADGSPPP